MKWKGAPLTVARRSWAWGRAWCEASSAPQPRNGSGAELTLSTIDGARSRLSEELAGADVAVMIATADDGAAYAEVIGQACARRSIMTAGLVFDTAGTARAAVAGSPAPGIFAGSAAR